MIPDEAPLAWGLAREMEAWLEGGGGEGSAASKTAFRRYRLRWVREVVAFLKRCDNLPIAYVTLTPKSWRREARDLHFIDPEKLKRRFRSLLGRRGINNLPGYIVGGIHGEYDANRGEWRPHVHCWVIGREMIEAIDKLRKDPDFKVTKPQAPRVHIRRGPFTDVARQSSYALQCWWPHRQTGDFAKTGKPKRTRRRRLPAMIQAVWLLWANDLRFQDFELLIGVRRGRDGLRPSR